MLLVESNRARFEQRGDTAAQHGQCFLLGRARFRLAFNFLDKHFTGDNGVHDTLVKGVGEARGKGNVCVMRHARRCVRTVGLRLVINVNIVRRIGGRQFVSRALRALRAVSRGVHARASLRAD